MYADEKKQSLRSIDMRCLDVKIYGICNQVKFANNGRKAVVLDSHF